MTDIKQLMKKLGFTEYETKAYLALLKEAPASGYAVAKNSGVPRSKIYEVLDGLTARGDALISEGNPPLYRPLTVEELIAKKKAEAERTLDEAGAVLSQLEAAGNDDGDIWNIRGRGGILEKARHCIERAEKRILIEIWAEDYEELEESLRSAARRGVKIFIVAYGAIEADGAEVYLHDNSEAITEEYGGRWLVLSVDDRQVVAGTLSFKERDRAAWTSHPGLVMPITEVIIHDLYIAELMKSHRESLEAAFGENLTTLREKFQMKMDFLLPYHQKEASPYEL